MVRTPLISPTKLEELSKAWEKIKDGVSYVAQVVQRYGVTEDAFFKQDYSSVPQNERERLNETIGRMNKVIEEHDEMGLFGNAEIARRFKEVCWGKK